MRRFPSRGRLQRANPQEPLRLVVKLLRPDGTLAMERALAAP